MTTIVAVETKKGVVFGSDTQVTSGAESENLAHAKFFTNNGITFGVAGAAELIQILKYLDLDAVPASVDVDRYVSTTLLTVVSDTYERLSAKFGVPPTHIGEVILGVRGRVYKIDSYGTVLRNTRGLQVTGSGGQWAMSILSTVTSPTISDVKRALEHAALNDIYTSGPFHVELIKSGN
jgi:ATP-dependent protease HslVU (ClpYQ) peptidase subunit